MTPEPLMQVRGLRKVYAPSHWWRKRLPFLALDNVDLAIQTGETLALVGESGCGKTTLAMCLVGLEQRAGVLPQQVILSDVRPGIIQVVPESDARGWLALPRQ